LASSKAKGKIMRTRGILLLGLETGLTALMLCMPVPAQANEKVYQQLLPSAVFVNVQKGKAVGFASGVLVDVERKWVVTNYHSVTPPKKADDPEKTEPQDSSKDLVQVAFPVKEKGMLIADKLEYIKNAKKWFYRGQVVFEDKAKDLTLIALENVPPDAKAVPLASSSAQPGQTVHFIGNPAGSAAFWLYSSGKVRQVFTKSFDGFTPDGKIIKAKETFKVVFTTLATTVGESGGPLVNDKGELVGILYGHSPEGSAGIDITEVRAFLEMADKQSKNK
jgi:S1-C subfamily serine protease